MARHFIREWRELRMTQVQLAPLMRMTNANLCQIELGNIGYNQRSLEAAAKALKCYPGDLLREPDVFDVYLAHLPMERRSQIMSAVRALVEMSSDIKAN